MNREVLRNIGALARCLPGLPQGDCSLIQRAALAWEEGLRLPLAADLDAELAATLEGVMTRLIGHVPRSTRFLAQTRRTLTAHP